MPVIREWFRSACSGKLPVGPDIPCTGISGKIYGHPGFEDGHEIITSEIVGKKGNCVVTKSGSLYELDEPSPKYQEAFPDALKQLLDSLPEISAP